MVTLHKGGKGEKRISINQLVIPDLWHIAQAELDLNCKDAILRTWHIAHDLRRTVAEMGETQTELLEACRAFMALDVGGTGTETVTYSLQAWNELYDTIKAAIAKATGEGEGQS